MKQGHGSAEDSGGTGAGDEEVRLVSERGEGRGFGGEGRNDKHPVIDVYLYVS